MRELKQARTHALIPSIWLILPAMLMAAILPAAAQHYSFKSYSREQGLTNTSVMDMLQDKNDLIWVGTQNGLFWYDGKTFREVSTKDQSSKYIVALHESADGTLWVGTRSGLVTRRGSQLEKIDVGEPITIAGTGTLASDKESHLYVAAPQGLLRLEATGQQSIYKVKWLSRKPVHTKKSLRRCARRAAKNCSRRCRAD